MIDKKHFAITKIETHLSKHYTVEFILLILLPVSFVIMNLMVRPTEIKTEYFAFGFSSIVKLENDYLCFCALWWFNGYLLCSCTPKSSSSSAESKCKVFLKGMKMKVSYFIQILFCQDKQHLFLLSQ